MTRKPVVLCILDGWGINANPAVSAPAQANVPNFNRIWTECPHSTVQVVGHTDNVGTAAFNQQLSEDRARAVANVLISNGTPANRIAWLGRGLNQPIASNATEAGRAQNRRVEIIITPTN